MDVDCNKACRTCGKIWSNPEEMHPIFHENADAQPHNLFTFNKYLADFLFNSLKIKVFDGMPQSICSDCNNGIIFITQFYAQCEIAQETLEKTLKFSISLDMVKTDISADQQVGNEDYDIGIYDAGAEFEISGIENNADNSLSANGHIEVSTPQNSEQSLKQSHKRRRKKGSVWYQKFPKAKVRTTKHTDQIKTSKISEESAAKRQKIICPKCKQIFYSTSKLIAHIIAEHKSQKCLICERKYITKDACTSHYKVHETLRYNCYACEMKFVIVDDLNSHLFTVHNIAVYACTYCSEKFCYKVQFNQHVKQHKYAEFTCKYCSKPFVSSGRLKAHETTHQPYSCKICKAEFPSKELRDEHSRCHTAKRVYKRYCNICGMGFKLQQTYNKHMREHSKTPVLSGFICFQCNEAFTTKSLLKGHMLKHTGHNPYYCELCDIEFTQTNYLNSHILDVHGGTSEMVSLHDEINITETSQDPINIKYECNWPPYLL